MNRTHLRIEGGEGQLSLDARHKRDEARRKRQREQKRKMQATSPEYRAKRAAYMRVYRSKADGSRTPEHGTQYKWKLGCHCDRCKMAKRDAQRKYRTGSIGPEHNLGPPRDERGRFINV